MDNYDELTSGFIDLADSPAPVVSDEESLEYKETTSDNTDEESGGALGFPVFN